MSREIELTDDEISKIREINNVNNQLLIEYGKIVLAKKQLESRKKRVDEQYEQNKDIERSFLKKMHDKYNDGELDLERGVFISNK